ncbi:MULTISPECIES: NEAT domain-containing protein [Lactobacillus]|uniref:NEAT domain-containing protein n=1 Tax=Lactobacillus TaxID=1578 RepID=UPI000CD876F9|nr:MULTISPECIES: NEAT domain-containing protein [Lactobacillus]RVU72067.1 cell surface protein [Lactobacillus xujianguonis]
MKRVIKILFLPILLCLCLVFSVKRVSAASVNYHAYKYGTHQTSMAVGYYAQPAEVEADGKQYLVTMTIRTKKSLSPWPVKVLSVAGQAPIKVVKTRHGSDYDYRYSFRTSNLKNEVSSKIKIDVPQVYRATHMISFSFDQSALPKLTGKKAKNLPTKDDQASEKTKADSGVANAELIAEAKKQSQAVAKKEKQLAHDRLLLNRQNQLANQHNQKMFYYTIFGGVISTLILLVVAVLLIMKIRNDHKKDKR